MFHYTFDITTLFIILMTSVLVMLATTIYVVTQRWAQVVERLNSFEEDRLRIRKERNTVLGERREAERLRILEWVDRFNRIEQSVRRVSDDMDELEVMDLLFRLEIDNRNRHEATQQQLERIIRHFEIRSLEELEAPANQLEVDLRHTEENTPQSGWSEESTTPPANREVWPTLATWGQTAPLGHQTHPVPSAAPRFPLSEHGIIIQERSGIQSRFVGSDGRASPDIGEGGISLQEMYDREWRVRDWYTQHPDLPLPPYYWLSAARRRQLREEQGEEPAEEEEEVRGGWV